MDASQQKASDFRNACHNFFNHPQVNVILTAALTLTAGYFGIMALLHRWVFFPFEPATLEEMAAQPDVFLTIAVIFFVYMVSLIACKIADLAWVKPALGAIIFGVMVRNITHFANIRILDPLLDETLRYLALCIILIRCGLRLNAELISTNWILPVGLSMISVLVEVAALILASHLIFGLPVYVAFILGFMLAATSCSTLLPTMRHFQYMNQGTEKSIPALVLTSSALDNMLCIFVSLVLIAIQFSTGNIATTIILVIGEALVGVIVGAVVGGFLWVFPRRQEKFKHFARSLALLAASIAFVFGANRLDCLFAGVLATLAATVTAQRMWRCDYDGENVDDDETVEARWFSRLWRIFAEPLVFCLLGMQLNFATLTWGTFLSGLAIVAIGLVFRAIATFFLTFCNELNVQEKTFTMICSIPKGSVQAAVGTTLVALLLAVPELTQWAPLVVSALVCSAGIAGSVGHLFVRVFGPFLLQYDFPETIHISNPNHNSYVETVKVDDDANGLVTFKQFKTITQVQSEGRRPYQF